MKKNRYSSQKLDSVKNQKNIILPGYYMEIDFSKLK